jgi:hypothetical protein
MVDNLFGTAFGFTKACQMGAIGVNALEPKGFRDCLDKGNIPKYNDSDEEKKINFNTYQIWLLAMLNNEQLWEQAQQIALTLSNYSKSEDTTTNKRREVEDLLSATKKGLFIGKLVTIVNGIDEAERIEILTDYAKSIHFMPADNVPYFLTLIRFQYSVINKNLKKR